MDNYERECERNEEIRKTRQEARDIAEKMKELYPSFKKFLVLEGRLKRAGYQVERATDLKIWEQL